MSTIRVNGQYETGLVKFNRKLNNELFIFFNNDLYIYHTDGTLIQQRDFDFNVTHAVQDEDSLIITYENGTLACYDWNKDKIVDELEDFGSVKSIAISSHRTPEASRVLVFGMDNGDITILK